MNAILIALNSHDNLASLPRAESPEPGVMRVFQDANVEVDLVSVRGTSPPVDDHHTRDRILVDFLGLPKFVTIRRAAELDSVGYDAILFAAGHGAMWDFTDDPDLARLGRDVYESGGVVAAVCHGAAALVNLTLSDGTYLVEGKEVSAFTNAEEEIFGLGKALPFRLQIALEERGAKHMSGPNFEPHVSVADRLVTGQNPASAAAVAREVVSLLTAPLH